MPPLPPILWQPMHPDAATSFFPFAITAALLPAAGFFAAIFFFFTAAPTEPVLADRPTAAARVNAAHPHAGTRPQDLLCMIAPFQT